MNDQLIENLLRKTPSPNAPADLHQKLVADIQLPRVEHFASQSFLKRWLPALAFAALLLTCCMVIAIQTNHLAVLKRENEPLRAQARNLEALRAANVEVARLRNENAELDRLQKDSAELARLRGEAAQLQIQAAGLDQLRAENQELLTVSRAAPGAPKDFFADAKAKAERVACVNNLKQIGVCFRVWAMDQDGNCPTNFICMTNELNTWTLLHCPGDYTRSVTNWADVKAGNVSYLLYTAGCRATDDPNIVATECPIHHTIGMLDGSVQQLSAKDYAEQVKVVNGRKVFQR